MNPSAPVLYILMRIDMASLADSPGKVAAQAAHAANAMVHAAHLKMMDDDLSIANRLRTLMIEWQNETSQGFGTCIVLSAVDKDMRTAVALALELGIHAGICHDPTYPVLDGIVIHKIPVDTCAFIFARKIDAEPVVKNFPLFGCR